MSRYWYFSATLPGLLFGAPSPFSDKEFLSWCKRLMSGRDYDELSRAVESFMAKEPFSAQRSKFLRNFIAWERTLRNELSRLRARKAERNEEEYLRISEHRDEAGRTAAACYAVEDPYQAELFLERERWNAIERMSSLSSFDVDFLIAYRLKLAINERLERLNAKSGSAGYQHLYSDILGRASRNAETQDLGVKA